MGWTVLSLLSLRIIITQCFFFAGKEIFSIFVLEEPARIPIAVLLAPKFGITGVWIALTVSSILKGIISPVWWQIVYYKQFKYKK